jgi:hypothetical protein
MFVTVRQWFKNLYFTGIYTDHRLSLLVSVRYNPAVLLGRALGHKG